MFRYVAQRVGRNDANDLASDVSLIAFRDRHRFNRAVSRSAKAWLFGIATNLIRRRARTLHRRFRAASRAAGEGYVSLGDDIEDRRDAQREFASIGDAINQLSRIDRETRSCTPSPTSRTKKSPRSSTYPSEPFAHGWLASGHRSRTKLGAAVNIQIRASPTRGMMTSPEPNGRGWLDRYVGSPQPTRDETEAARAHLEAAITRERSHKVRRVSRPLRWVTAAVTLAVIIVAIVVVGPRAPDAALIDLARATRDIPPEELRPGSYIYFHTEQKNLTDGPIGDPDDPSTIIYLLPSTIDEWWQDDTVERHRTARAPTFFDPETEQAYHDAGLDQVDGINQTQTQTVTGVTTIDWSTNPETLATQIDAFLTDSQAPLPNEVEVFQLAQRILAPNTNPHHSSGAPVIEVISRLPIHVDQNADGTITVAIEYQDATGAVTEQVTFNQTGHVTAHKLTLNRPIPGAPISPGTTISQFTRTPPRVADQPGVIPPPS